ncbi:MAG: polysaccharide biosynthesis tyrosine autokinase [Verrucomicrobiaceae bacterium]|nr:polysaccharide biosynthesis tyrosine autokinase [Verrucomicrobiaceae bacterium]
MEQSLSLPGQSATLSRIHETSAKFQRYKILLRRRWWFLLLTASIGVCVQALRITGKPQSYISLAKMVAGGRMIGTGGGSGVGIQYLDYLQDFYGTIIETIESSEMRRRALDRVRALHPDMKESDVEIQVSQNRGSAIFNVRAFGTEPKYTRIFLDALLDEFIAFRNQIREQQRNKALTTLAEDVVRREKNLQEKQDKLTSFEKANNIVLITAGNNEAAQALRKLKDERDTALTTVTDIDLWLQDVDSAMQQREVKLKSAKPAEAAPGAAAQANQAADRDDLGTGLTLNEREYLETQRFINQLQSERTKLLKSMKPQHPEVVEIDEKISDATALLKFYQDKILGQLKNQKSALDRRITALDGLIKVKEAEAIDLGSKIAMHDGLTKDYSDSKKGYDEILDLVRRFTVGEDMTSDHVTIMERASGAVEDLQEWILPIVVGLAAGLGAGVVILLLFDRLDDRMDSFSEFQALFPNEAVLGQIPEQRQRGDVQLLRPNDDRHLYAEAFRNIRSSILFKNWRGKAPKVILVTSAVPNEGKTTCVSNLAITMALAGSRVLLADCDLRRGGVNELFKAPVAPGLSEVLRGKTHWRDAVQETSTRNLDLLARGEVLDQTSEMLLSKTAEEMLREMADEYDYVIFDSAPVLVADDTASFAPKTDTVLFVVRMSSTMARLTGKALDLLYERQVNVGGVILNRSSTNLKEYTYYNYASYYYTPKPAAPSPAPANP